MAVDEKQVVFRAFLAQSFCGRTIRRFESIQVESGYIYIASKHVFTDN